MEPFKFAPLPFGRKAAWLTCWVFRAALSLSRPGPLAPCSGTVEARSAAGIVPGPRSGRPCIRPLKLRIRWLACGLIIRRKLPWVLKNEETGWHALG
jgi:hypothetical protein